MRVAAYVRVSSEEQAKEGNSLFEQEDRLKSYCRAMRWEEPEIFIDDGYSAKDLNRPALTRLLNNAKEHKYDIVLTTKLDRLSRKLYDILSLVRFFERHNCAYASMSESFDTSTPSGTLTLQVLGAVAEFERERNRERVRDNLISLAKQGKLIGKPAYGYDVINGEYVVNIEESLIVKKMFEWTLNGFEDDPKKKPAGPLSIAGRLNQMGIPTKNGTDWNERQVRRMLLLETYIGQYIYNRTYRKGTREIVRPEEEWIIIQDHHEPIIDIVTFNKVREIILARKRASKQHHSDDKYLLSGLVYCAHCGEKMTGRQVQRPANKTRPQVQPLYICSGYQKKGKCFFHFVYRDELEKLIVKDIHKVARARPEKLKLILSEAPSKLSEKDLFQSQLKKIDQRMQKQIEAWEKDLISDHDLKLARERLETERASIIKAIEDMERVAATSEQFKVHAKVKEVLDDITSADRIKMKTAIAMIINKIHVTGGKDVTLTWNRL